MSNTRQNGVEELYKWISQQIQRCHDCIAASVNQRTQTDDVSSSDDCKACKVKGSDEKT